MHSVVERLQCQAEMCAAMGSPLYAAMLCAASDDFDTHGPTYALFGDPEALLSRIGIRLMGALHYLALDESELEFASHLPSTGGDGNADAAWHAVCDVLQRRFGDIVELVKRTPQTNEVARSMPLMAGLLAIADRTRLPLRIFEIGSSAGLNLRLDAYRYVGEGWSWGRADSSVELRNRVESGFPKYLDACVEILERRGCDVHPLDATDPAAQRELSARDELRAQIAACGSRATNDASVAWLRMESSENAYETRVTLWPSGEDMLIATSDGHAQGLRWAREGTIERTRE